MRIIDPHEAKTNPSQLAEAAAGEPAATASAGRQPGGATEAAAGEPATASAGRQPGEASPPIVAFGSAGRPTNPARSLHRSTAQTPGAVHVPAQAGRRLGFLAGRIAVPSDFDRMGAAEIARRFGGEE